MDPVNAGGFSVLNYVVGACPAIYHGAKYLFTVPAGVNVALLSSDAILAYAGMAEIISLSGDPTEMQVRVDAWWASVQTPQRDGIEADKERELQRNRNAIRRMWP